MNETADILETAVNRGKTNVGDLVKGLDPLHDHFADFIGADFPLQGILDALLDFGGDPIQISHIHLPLVESTDHGIHDLVPVKALAGAVTLNDNDGKALHNLICGDICGYSLHLA